MWGMNDIETGYDTTWNLTERTKYDLGLSKDYTWNCLFPGLFTFPLFFGGPGSPQLLGENFPGFPLLEVFIFLSLADLNITNIMAS